MKNFRKILKGFCVTIDTSWPEHFLKSNKQGVWNKNVLGGKFSEN